MQVTLQTSYQTAEADLGRLGRELLSGGAVDRVFICQYDGSGQAVYGTLVTRPDRLADPAPLAPYMNGNKAREAGTASMDPDAGTLAVFARPCEARALVELSKLNQADRDHVLLITVDCPGTLSLADYKAFRRTNPSPGQSVEAFYRGFGVGRRPDEAPVRPCCTRCESLAHPDSDIRILLVGAHDGEVVLDGRTEAGQKALRALDISEAAPSVDPATRTQFIEAQQRRRDEFDAAWAEEIKTPGDFLGLLTHCRRCYNCRAECPICHCRECVFQTETFAVEADTFTRRAARDGAIKMPPDTLMFHLTRLNHLAASCISCGQCTEACPQSVDVARAFSAVGRRVQKLFDYRPGNDPADELPLNVFREDEFEPR